MLARSPLVEKIEGQVSSQRRIDSGGSESESTIEDAAMKGESPLSDILSENWPFVELDAVLLGLGVGNGESVRETGAETKAVCDALGYMLWKGAPALVCTVFGVSVLLCEVDIVGLFGDDACVLVGLARCARVTVVDCDAV